MDLQSITIGKSARLGRFALTARECYTDNNKKPLDGVGFVRNTVIDKNVYNFHIIPLIIYLCLL